VNCGYPDCTHRALWLVRIEARPNGPNNQLRVDLIPGIKVCTPHIPDITGIGPKIKEFLGVELDKLGGKRPYNFKAQALPISGPEARAYFAAQPN